LVTEDGTTIESARDVHDFIDAALTARSRTRLLRYVDPHGDTYFNARQMDDFLADWHGVTPVAVSALERDCVAHVRELAEQCRDSTHLLLRFVGD
jgi:hypothetical protein